MIIVPIINAVFTVFYILLWARIIISFIPFSTLSPYHPIRRTVFDLTEPIMAPFRRILPPMGGFDLSIILVFIAARFLQRILIQLLVGF